MFFLLFKEHSWTLRNFKKVLKGFKKKYFSVFSFIDPSNWSQFNHKKSKHPSEASNLLEWYVKCYDEYRLYKVPFWGYESVVFFSLTYVLPIEKIFIWMFKPRSNIELLQSKLAAIKKSSNIPLLCYEVSLFRLLL